MPSKPGVPVSPSGSLVVKSLWPSRSDSLGFPVPLSGPQAGKPGVGFRTFTTVGELLWYYCSSICESPTKWIWDLIVVILPLLLSHCSFFFIFERGVSFFGRFQGPPVGGCSTASCDFGALTGGRMCASFHSAILNQTRSINF